ncbi:hypothetical protein [Enterococcus asini]|uniref:hypothetical protein n=1 Tax=Enterococcus TaxID=1350 RepID=UPI001958C519|nr:hypothetical protein [Enterococcus asini]
MKRKGIKLVILGGLFLGMLVIPQVATAATVQSEVSIQFFKADMSGQQPGTTLPKTGDLGTGGLLTSLGIIFLVFGGVIIYKQRERKV